LAPEFHLVSGLRISGDEAPLYTFVPQTGTAYSGAVENF